MIESRRDEMDGNVERMGRRGTCLGYWRKARRKETTRKTET
jgi:hypothetical protein